MKSSQSEKVSTAPACGQRFSERNLARMLRFAEALPDLEVAADHAQPQEVASTFHSR